MRLALVIVDATTVARRMGLAPRTARAWVSGARRPENPREVARVIAAVAHEAGLGWPSDEHLRPEEICAELPGRPALVQFFASTMVAMLADRFGGLRAFSRALAGEGGPNLEPTVRRWLALATGELRPVHISNGIVARLAKLSRAHIRGNRRRVLTEPGSAGDRQAVLGFFVLLHGAEKPLLLPPEEALFAPFVILLAMLIAALLELADKMMDFGARESQSLRQ